MQIQRQNNIVCLIMQNFFLFDGVSRNTNEYSMNPKSTSERKVFMWDCKSKVPELWFTEYAWSILEKQFVFKQVNFIMRKLPKAFSYSGYLSERWIYPLWAIKPIDYLTWLLKSYGLRILSNWYIPPSPRMYYWRMILWYCSISGKHCSRNKHEEIIHMGKR